MKALVVDDSGVMRDVEVAALARAGISDVDQAVDGQEAVDLCQANDYDIVLLDWNMPNKNGLEALKEMRGMGKSFAVIMVTTESEKARIVEAIRAGANNYIVKPFEPEAFLAKIESAMAQAAQK